MSASLRLHCDGEYQYGTCTRAITGPIHLDPGTTAKTSGWLTRGTRHFCPDCQRAGRHNTAVNR